MKQLEETQNCHVFRGTVQNICKIFYLTVEQLSVRHLRQVSARDAPNKNCEIKTIQSKPFIEYPFIWNNNLTSEQRKAFFHLKYSFCHLLNFAARVAPSQSYAPALQQILLVR